MDEVHEPRQEPLAEPRSPTPRTPVDIAIAGASRSGSTILALMLGRHPDVAVMGETNIIAKKWNGDPSWLCGCGVPMRECQYWNALAAEAEFDALTTPAGAARYRGAVRALTGALVTVDTSKTARDLDASNGASFVVHIVRDPRGSALSRHRGWGRSNHEGHPDLRHTVRVGAWWLRENLAAERLRRRRGGLLVRYEDFVVDHERICDEILGHVGLTSTTTSWREHHVATGNPVRREGEQTVEPDLEWRERLPRRLQVAGWLTTLPLSALYRYPPVAARRR